MRAIQEGTSHRYEYIAVEQVIKNNPETKFVLLHCGFPWVDDLFSIVDGYPNLYPDLTWLPILSYTASKRVSIS